MDMWVPLKEKEKKIKQSKFEIKNLEELQTVQTKVLFFKIFFSFLYFVLRFTSFGPSEFVGINTESALRDEGYA